jgi:hypothetical protein
MSLGRLTVALFFATTWLACQTPADSMHSMQLEFFRARPPAAVFIVTAENDTLQLPLPPPAGQAEALQQLAETFRPRAAAFDTTGLEAAEQAEWRRFQQFLDSLAVGPPPANHPARYALDDLLRHFVGRDRAGRHPGLAVALVEQLPNYYEKVEANWQVPDTSAAAEATRRALISLELLDRLAVDATAYSIGYRERIQKALPAARYAIKDFIGLCESAK